MPPLRDLTLMKRDGSRHRDCYRRRQSSPPLARSSGTCRATLLILGLQAASVEESDVSASGVRWQVDLWITPQSLREHVDCETDDCLFVRLAFDGSCLRAATLNAMDEVESSPSVRPWTPESGWPCPRGSLAFSASVAGHQVDWQEKPARQSCHAGRGVNVLPAERRDAWDVTSSPGISHR